MYEVVLFRECSGTDSIILPLQDSKPPKFKSFATAQ